MAVARAHTRPSRATSGERGPRPEKVLIVAVTALVCFGIVMVYSASSASALLTHGDPKGQVVRQALYALVGVGAYLAATRMRVAGLRRLGPAAMVISLVLLVLVLIPGIGVAVNGSRRWIPLGPLGSIQPSELAKLARVLWIAQLAASRPRALREFRGLLPYFGALALIGLLVLLEPDMDGIVVLGAVVVAMLAIAGARPAHLAAISLAGMLPALIMIVAEPYRRDRFIAFFDQTTHASAVGYQALQAKIAFGVGGITGVGLGDGVQKASYLPEASTDMILATVGEELGLLGVILLICGFAAFAYAGFRIALGAPDLHQQLLAAGITVMVVVQAIINMGAVLGIIPVAGLTLPFVSFGGSSLIILLACTGILVNIARRSSTATHVDRIVPADAGDDRRRRDGRPRDARVGGGRRAAGARG